MTEATDVTDVTDVTAVPTSGGSGVIWTLTEGRDLNVNLVRLQPGDAIDAHRNDEVDVLLHVRSGAGHLVVDGHTHPLRVDHLVLVERGATRSIHAGGDGLTYLTVHRRRGPLTIGR